MISDRLAALLRRELKLAAFEFRDETRAYEVPGWDSLEHVAILCAVEEEYAIRLKSLEVLRLKTVGDLQRLIERKVGAG